MGSTYEAETTIFSAKHLKNVNWQNGSLKPYVVLWAAGYDCGGGSSTVAANKSSTSVGRYEEEDPVWDEKLVISLPNRRVEDLSLYFDVVHARSTDDVKPVKVLIGSGRLPLKDVVDGVGIGTPTRHTIELVRPSGRPHGKLKLEVDVRPPVYVAPDPYYHRTSPATYDVPPLSRGYGAAPQQPPPPPPQQPYGFPNAPPPPPDNYYSCGAPPPPAYAEFPRSYVAPPPPTYGEIPRSYGAPQSDPYSGYGAAPYGKDQKKSGKFGMGTGLAVGAAAGLLGGLALSEGIDYVEDKIADRVEDKVEDYEDDDDV